MQASRGRGVYLLLILDLGTKWGCGQRHVPATLYLRGKDLWSVLDGMEFIKQWKEHKGRRLEW
jgi:hypothetical protein